MATRILCHLLARCRFAQQKHGSQYVKNSVFPTYQGWRALHKPVSDKDSDWYLSRESSSEPGRFDEPLITANIDTEQFLTKSKKSLKTKKREEIDIEEISCDPNVFGTTRLPGSEIEDEGDAKEEEFLAKRTLNKRKLTTKQYAHLIKEHLAGHRLAEAIKVLEVRMLKEDFVKPEYYIYNLLISGCAKAGNTKKAFKLFSQMRQRGLKVTGGTYTSLFNACANSPYSKEISDKAQRVREIMFEKGYEPNEVNYNAMIKAFGRAGDLKTAFMLADEMEERNMALNTESYNFLLQSCASEKEYGFRHCLLTWHKMMKRHVIPDRYTFSTILRCVRDCGFGDLQTMRKVLLEMCPQIHINNSFDKDQSQTLESNSLEVTVSEERLQLSTEATHFESPNLLLPKPRLGSLVSLSEVKLPHERLLLLGGTTGFLDVMKSYNVTPGIEFFTLMLDVVPPTNSAEKQILSYVRKIGLKADIDFFNIMIKKRSMRFDYEGAREVLSMLRAAKLKPDIVTYGVLALGCKTRDEARDLLLQMQTADVRINIQILGAMLRQGCANKNFKYINEIMQISLDEEVKPNDIFLRHLHSFYSQCARAIDARHPYTQKAPFKTNHMMFCDKYRMYYEEQGLTGLKLEDAIKKITKRPYEQFESSLDDGGIEPLKNEELARKQKVRKYIKNIKLQNLSSKENDENEMMIKSH